MNKSLIAFALSFLKANLDDDIVNEINDNMCEGEEKTLEDLENEIDKEIENL